MCTISKLNALRMNEEEDKEDEQEESLSANKKHIAIINAEEANEKTKLMSTDRTVVPLSDLDVL